MFLHRPGLWGFRLMAGSFRLLPMRCIFFISDLLAPLLSTLVRYRKKIVMKNLRLAFPERDEGEIKKISSLFYKRLADNFLETIKSFSLSEDSLRKRMQYQNPELIQRYIDAGTSVLVVGGHFYSWELGVQVCYSSIRRPVTGIFKPLSNPLVERHLNRLRERFGNRLVSMNQALRTIVKQKEVPTMYVFIADQSPSNVEAAHWVPFFGRMTGFLQGVDKIARATGYPVIYYSIERKARGRYELRFSELCTDSKQRQEGEITYLFAQKLEEDIRAHPDGWLWSHNRWKRTMPKNAKIWPSDALSRQSDNSQNHSPA